MDGADLSIFHQLQFRKKLLTSLIWQSIISACLVRLMQWCDAGKRGI